MVSSWQAHRNTRPGERETNCQPACKPGSVRPAFADATAIHLGRLSPGVSRNQPGQLAWKPAWPGIASGPRCPYSVLLPVGFTVPLLLPVARWALTPPFHPYPGKPRRFAFCGTFPEVALAGCYPAPCFLGARTFLSCGLSTLAAAAVRPTGACGLKWLSDRGQAKE